MNLTQIMIVMPIAGLALLAIVLAVIAPLLKRHEACRPEKRPDVTRSEMAEVRSKVRRIAHREQQSPRIAAIRRHLDVLA